MKQFVLLTGLALAMQAQAQKDIDGMIQAEKNFAAYSVANGTKEAFLTFLDSASSVFDKGQPVNGIAFWTKKGKAPGVLNWHPQFAEIAASNELGYTTGPWTFQPQTVHDSVVANGQFTTIWHINKNGEWKALVDLGVNNLPSVDSQEVQPINLPKISTQPIDLASLVKTEEAFIKAYKKSTTAAYQQYLSANSILNRHKNLPATTPEQQEAVITATPKDMQFKILHSHISSTGDMGFIYGTVLFNQKTDNYLRIWRRELDGWKIALEVVRY